MAPKKPKKPVRRSDAALVARAIENSRKAGQQAADASIPMAQLIPATSGWSRVLGKLTGSKAVGDIPGAVSSVAQAYFSADATKEVARQKADAEKTVAAVGVNQAIMHELDRPCLVYEKHTKRSSLRASLSVMSLYFLGTMAEKAYNASMDYTAGRAADHFTRHLLMIRAPLQAIPGSTALREADTGPASTTAPSGWAAVPNDQRAGLWMQWALAHPLEFGKYLDAQRSGFATAPPGWHA